MPPSHGSVMASLASALQIPTRTTIRSSTTIATTTKTAARRPLHLLATRYSPSASAAAVAPAASAHVFRNKNNHASFLFGRRQQQRQPQQQTAQFSATAMLAKKKKKGAGPVDRRIKMIRYALTQPTKHLPGPLQFSRLRALRHWTIHRAWQLWQRTQRTSHARELERQWESMRAACEELRVGAGDGGRLFRQAMAKKGYWGGRSKKGGEAGIRPGFETGDSGRVEKGREGGVPIEYAKGLVDTPARAGAWDHAWTR